MQMPRTALVSPVRHSERYGPQNSLLERECNAASPRVISLKRRSRGKKHKTVKGSNLCRPGVYRELPPTACCIVEYGCPSTCAGGKTFDERAEVLGLSNGRTMSKFYYGYGRNRPSRPPPARNGPLERTPPVNKEVTMRTRSPCGDDADMCRILKCPCTITNKGYRHRMEPQLKRNKTEGCNQLQESFDNNGLESNYSEGLRSIPHRLVWSNNLGIICIASSSIGSDRSRFPAPVRSTCGRAAPFVGEHRPDLIKIDSGVVLLGRRDDSVEIDTKIISDTPEVIVNREDSDSHNEVNDLPRVSVRDPNKILVTNNVSFAPNKMCTKNASRKSSKSTTQQQMTAKELLSMQKPFDQIRTIIAEADVSSANFDNICINGGLDPYEKGAKMSLQQFIQLCCSSLQHEANSPTKGAEISGRSKESSSSAESCRTERTDFESVSSSLNDLVIRLVRNEEECSRLMPLGESDDNTDLSLSSSDNPIFLPSCSPTGSSQDIDELFESEKPNSYKRVSTNRSSSSADELTDPIFLSTDSCNESSCSYSLKLTKFDNNSSSIGPSSVSKMSKHKSRSGSTSLFLKVRSTSDVFSKSSNCHTVTTEDQRIMLPDLGETSSGSSSKKEKNSLNTMSSTDPVFDSSTHSKTKSSMPEAADKVTGSTTSQTYPDSVEPIITSSTLPKPITVKLPANTLDWRKSPLDKSSVGAPTLPSPSEKKKGSCSSGGGRLCGKSKKNKSAGGKKPKKEKKNIEDEPTQPVILFRPKSMKIKQRQITEDADKHAHGVLLSSSTLSLCSLLPSPPLTKARDQQIVEVDDKLMKTSSKCSSLSSVASPKKISHRSSILRDLSTNKQFKRAETNKINENPANEILQSVEKNDIAPTSKSTSLDSYESTGVSHNIVNKLSKTSIASKQPARGCNDGSGTRVTKSMLQKMATLKSLKQRSNSAVSSLSTSEQSQLPVVGERHDEKYPASPMKPTPAMLLEIINKKKSLMLQSRLKSMKFETESPLMEE